MADYDTLKTDIVAWCEDRTDIEPRLDGFIRLAEAGFNDVLRTRDMYKSEELVPDVGTSRYSLPADYLQWRSFQMDDGNGLPLDIVQDDYGAEERFQGNNAGDRLRYLKFTASNQVSVIGDPDGRKLFVRYYSKIPTIIDNGTNWLYQRAPGAYLFMCCAYAQDWIGSDVSSQRAGKFFEMGQSELARVTLADETGLWSKAQTRVRGVRP